MDMMDGLAGTLAGMQEDAGVALKMSGGFVLGLAIARFVDKTVSDLEFAKTQTWVPMAAPALPILVGLALFTKTRDSYPALGGANGLGMIGYGLARYAKIALDKAATKADGTADAESIAAKASSYLSLGAVDTYESSLVVNGLGYSDMGINRYLPRFNGLGDSRSPGAPTFVETVSGAPTSVTAINGAPTSVTTLQGLSATLM